MVISFSSDVLINAQTNVKTLRMIQHILSLVNIGRHKLFVNEDQILLFQQIMDELDIYEEIIKQYASISDKVKPEFFVVIDKKGNILNFQNTYNMGPNAKIKKYPEMNKVTIKSNNSAWNFECEFISMTNYYSYICDNLKIMLEDKVSDGAFLIALIRTYLSEEIDMDYIDIEGCAGCVSRNMLAVEKKNRVLSFVDSDKKHRKMKPSDGKDKEHKKLQIIAMQRGYRIIFLKKREIENYIPERLLKLQYPEHVYYNLNEEQKAFFDLKYGLKLRDFLEPLVYELYKNILSVEQNNEIKAYKEKILKNPNYDEHGGIGIKTIVPGFDKDVYQNFNKKISKKEFDCVDYFKEFNQILLWIKRYV